ncbi:PAS-domain containing protein [Paracoccus homiensis]|uniref:PAS domain-containing protein n=1 Tax=Paracoccus homiensis TaxID=364199 RepID=A0A1H9Z6Y2_9RHOB|nr:PAS-domain containing protein [Paracoccus homiensis]SES77331.1 PAS domain-containing protein [Paracoccus homiensis]
MASYDLWSTVAALVAGTFSVVLAILCIRAYDRLKGRRPQATLGTLSDGLQPVIFLFRDRQLVDATGPARSLLDHAGGPDGDWPRLMAWIAPRFPDAARHLSELGARLQIDLTGSEGMGSAALSLRAEDLGEGLVRISVNDPSAEHAGILVDSLSQQAMEEELDLLRRALDQTPMLVWRQDADSRITWANAAYLRRAEVMGDGDLPWPLPRLLESPKPVPGAGTKTRRASLDDHGVVSWYDCHSHKMGDQTMMFALPADAAVRAERSLREFVQTLTKTFADLPIGLAIFDRQRRLQLFNPALIDLTGLPTGFLTARPTLLDFLDQLREHRMVPEPKDYRSWRQQMSNLESAAATGHHVEEWSLPNGRTYRVTGRPHPDGAVAFLFDDITSEIALTRQFRSDLLMGSAVLDRLDDALAVFEPSGKIVLTNQAYRDMWPSAAGTLTEALAEWKSQGQTGPGLAALEARLQGQPEARDTGAILDARGHLIGWSVSFLGGTNQLLSFKKNVAVQGPVRPEPDRSASLSQVGAR